MTFSDKRTVRVAVLDMYAGEKNEGIRCLREILSQFGKENHLDLVFDEFEVRIKNEIPDLSYDIYLSSGGPGSPLESEGSKWEEVYFRWVNLVEAWNNNEANQQKKYVFFICHSFQLVCRYWKLANVCKRKSTAFGIFPVHMLEDGKREPVYQGLQDPFYAVDSRDWQIIQPDINILYKGAKILSIEKDRPHVPLERAIMAMRFNDYFIGTQFHPEADAIGMRRHLESEEKKKIVIENYGFEKWRSMIEYLSDPDKISWTHSRIIPNFLHIAIESLQEQMA
jgi:homoserine O-succinyltransferase/O-acetyltransferase